jgi:uncharacterized protein with HEPN domain
MSERTARAWRFYIDDMVTFATKVLAYVDGLDQTAFVADERTYDATLRNLELLGEAASHVPDHARTAHPEIPWRMIIATRARAACTRFVVGSCSTQSRAWLATYPTTC